MTVKALIYFCVVLLREGLWRECMGVTNANTFPRVPRPVETRMGSLGVDNQWGQTASPQRFQSVNFRQVRPQPRLKLSQFNKRNLQSFSSRSPQIISAKWSASVAPSSVLRHVKPCVGTHMAIVASTFLEVLNEVSLASGQPMKVASLV